MEQIWIQYRDKVHHVIRMKKFWWADDARRFIRWLKSSDDYELLAQGGYENNEELEYANE